MKWFKPTLDQFQIFCKSGIDQKEYQPVFGPYSRRSARFSTVRILRMALQKLLAVERFAALQLFQTTDQNGLKLRDFQ